MLLTLVRISLLLWGQSLPTGVCLVTVLQVKQPAPKVKLVSYHKTLPDYAMSNKILKDLCKCQFTFYCRGIISTLHIIFQLRKTTLTLFQFHVFLWFLALDVTAYCICEIHCLAIYGFNLNTVHNLSSKEKKSQRSRDSNPGLLGGKQECFHCATQPPWFNVLIFFVFRALSFSLPLKN